MDLEITLKNYRCFPDTRPARFRLRGGNVALVGPNNAGKSTVLRFFLEFRELLDALSSPPRLLGILRGQSQARAFGSSVKDDTEVFCNTNDREMTIELRFFPETPPAKDSPYSVPQGARIVLPRRDKTWTATLTVDDRLLPPTDAYSLGSDRFLSGGILHRNVDIRGFFEVTGSLARTLYVGPFRNAINVRAEEAYYDLKIGQAFITHWRELRTGASKDNQRSTRRVTRDIQELFGFRTLEINTSHSGKGLNLSIDDEDYRLDEVGTGLGQVIVVLTSAAIRRPSYVLIDEPELNLHPSLQLAFLTTLASYAREGVVYATHSIGLARAGADLIYSVRQDPDGGSQVAELERTPRLSEFLGELSFSGYRELGFDRILLVEGKTDVKTMQQLLRLYRKDHETVILPLGGNTLINGSVEVELQELKRISSNVFALIDSERTNANEALPTNRSAFFELCKVVGIKCHVLERRAVENYFPLDAIQRVKGEKYMPLEAYQPLEDADSSWAKTENWRIAREMTRSDLEGTDLGRFLASAWSPA